MTGGGPGQKPRSLRMRRSCAVDHTPPSQLQPRTPQKFLCWGLCAAQKVTSLNFYCWAVALLLTPWDASRPGFNLLQSEASGEGASQEIGGHAKEGGGGCPCLLWISHLCAGSMVIKAHPYPQSGAVGSALSWVFISILNWTLYLQRGAGL